MRMVSRLEMLGWARRVAGWQKDKKDKETSSPQIQHDSMKKCIGAPIVKRTKCQRHWRESGYFTGRIPKVAGLPGWHWQRNIGQRPSP